MRREIFEAAHLIRENLIDRAICLLISLSDETLDKEEAGMKHLHLGIAHGKRQGIDQSNVHYRKAIEYGHKTGMAYEKLAINLAKQGKLEEAIEVCQRLIEHPTIPAPRSYLMIKDMQRRKEKLEARLARRKI
jgi:tetratricopeptide (TPR) repeat protein